MADKPITREEKYLAYLTGDYTGELPKPITRKEKYLYELCLKGMGGEVSPEEIKSAVNEYFEKNPVKPGATTEQAQQIEQNKTDIASLKEDISNKITKFYASNLGETHITDSDNGKIQDMMIYGKSEQFTTTGKNLLKIKDGTQTTRGITVTAKDGVVALKGTATEAGWVTLDTDSFMLDGTYILSSNITTMQVRVANKLNKEVLKQNKSATLENEEVSKVTFPVTGGKTYDVSNILVQIEKGSVATSYEPYTGGQPSPSPDYPQEIKSVVKPVYKVHGRNLVKSYRNNKTNKPYASTLYVEIDEIMPDTQYVLSMIIADGNKAYINEDLVKFTKVTGDGTRKQIVVTTLSNISKTNARLYEKGKGWCILKNDESNTIVSDTKDVQLEIGTVATSYEPYKEQTVTLPYTLNAIPVDSDGNYTDADGQQWICDEIDFARGKYVQRLEAITIDSSKLVTYTSSWITQYEDSFVLIGTQIHSNCIEGIAISNIASKPSVNIYFQNIEGIDVADADRSVRFRVKASSAKEAKEKVNGKIVIVALKTPIETDLRDEEIAAYKALTTYYPVTNISVNSDQLDGYTVFNYPASMANGWNYVKQQLSDNRDYIYDMDAKTQDIDTQSTEAYVNSEYAVALTELEAM